MLFVACMLFVAWWLLFVGRCVPRVDCCAMCRLLWAVCRLLGVGCRFGVWRVLLGVLFCVSCLECVVCYLPCVVVWCVLCCLLSLCGVCCLLVDVFCCCLLVVVCCVMSVVCCLLCNMSWYLVAVARCLRFVVFGGGYCMMVDVCCAVFAV